jgi:UDP-galactopyranose mutase
MPLHGYTRMFENMLDHPNIKVLLNCDYREIEDTIPYREMIYTGPIDEFFDFRFGKLPYRSLRFKHETHNRPLYQCEAVINYPNEHAFTRITEFPESEGDPYYPVPRQENRELYARYKALADATTGVHFVGRLATYKYYNMDQVTGQALATFKKLSETIAQTPAVKSTTFVPHSTKVSFPIAASSLNEAAARRRSRLTSKGDPEEKVA